MDTQSIALMLVVLCTVMWSGCGGTTPSGSDGKKIVERQIAQQGKGTIKLLDFQKTNAQKGKLMGVELVSIEYEAQIEFTADCWWGGPLGGFEVMTDQPGALNFFQYLRK